MAKKVDFWTDDPDSPVIDCEDFITKLAQARVSDESPDLDADEIGMLLVLTVEELRQSVEDEVHAGKLLPRGKDMLPLRQGFSRGDLEPFHNLYFEKESFLSFARTAWLIVPKDGNVESSPRKTNGITIAAIGWMIATQRLAEGADHKPSIEDDDGLRRTIEIAMRLHGWPADGIAGVVPQIAAMTQAGHIAVHSISGDKAYPDAAAILAKPDAWSLSGDDAQRVLAALCPSVRRYTLTDIAESIAKRSHPNDYVAEYALKTSLAAELRRAVERDELPANERRRNGEILLNECAVDEWCAREGKPYRLGVSEHTEYEQAEMENAGRLRIRDVAAKLAEETSIDTARWETTLLEAIKGGALPLKNPRNLADSLPYVVPTNLRAYYDRIELADVNKLLDTNPDWRVSHRFTVESALVLAAQTSARLVDGGIANDVGITKRERQIQAIESVADELGYDRLQVPDGGKGKIRTTCKSKHAELFGFGDAPFDDAWKEASKANRVRMANRDKFAGR